MLPSLAPAIVAASPDAILVATGDGSWIDANPAALTLLGYGREALLEQSVAAVVATGPVGAGDVFDRVLREEPWQGEVFLRRSDGRLVAAAARAIAIRGPDGPVVAWFLHGVAACTREEVALRAALAAAETEILAKGVFLDLMSHELRTPLQAVLGYAEFLLDRTNGSLTAEQRADIDAISRAGNRMLVLINQALDLSRLGAGGITLATEPVDLAQVIETVRQDIAPQAAAKELVVEITLAPSLPAVLGDAERVRQILLNLVGNAVKFTDAGHVRITAAAVATGGVEIVVRDTGVGIAADALPHIFAAFHQAPGGPTRRHGGSGLGLAIAARLADQMAGSIDVRSEPNIGTTFRLRLPEAPSAAAAAREPAVAAPDDPA